MSCFIKPTYVCQYEFSCKNLFHRIFHSFQYLSLFIFFAIFLPRMVLFKCIYLNLLWGVLILIIKHFSCFKQCEHLYVQSSLSFEEIPGQLLQQQIKKKTLGAGLRWLYEILLLTQSVKGSCTTIHFFRSVLSTNCLLFFFTHLSRIDAPTVLQLPTRDGESQGQHGVFQLSACVRVWVHAYVCVCVFPVCGPDWSSTHFIYCQTFLLKWTWIKKEKLSLWSNWSTLSLRFCCWQKHFIIIIEEQDCSFTRRVSRLHFTDRSSPEVTLW